MKNIKTELIWAFRFTAMMLLWMVLEKMAGLHDQHIDKHPVFTNFVAIPAITIYVLALLDKRKTDYQGVMNYKQGVLSGLIITAIVTILTPFTQYVTSTFITPNYFANVIKYSVETGKMTQKDAESYFNLNSYMIQATIGALIMGVVTTLIVAIFVRKRVA
jgi:hypothetical protein